ncbi:DUF3822 family protein [Arthrospiribacter ruber]|uniref:DUF3822 family protein n=1 Tax=Arthrospiribacter ruber TaxID=2487934 RepID=UPI001C5AA03A|nr:DUF3822 family protein [Arthrospiribacter ruber]
MASSVIHTQEKYLSDKFDINTVSSLSLFLYEHTALLIAKDQNNKVIAAESFNEADQEKVVDTILESDIFNRDIPTAFFIHNSNFSLVPGTLFNQSFLSTYLSFAGKTENIAAFDTPLESNSLHLVGSVDFGLYQKLTKEKTSFRFHHGAASFLSYCFKSKTNLLNQEILISWHDGSFYLAGFSKQELQIFNRFEAKDRDQLLSYVFGIMHQLNFNRKLCRITIFGDTSTLEIDQEWGNLYFKNFRLSDPDSNVHYAENVDNILKSAAFETRWTII